MLNAKAHFVNVHVGHAGADVQEVTAWALLYFLYLTHAGVLNPLRIFFWTGSHALGNMDGVQRLKRELAFWNLQRDHRWESGVPLFFVTVDKQIPVSPRRGLL